jgi:hypothetical protein
MTNQNEDAVSIVQGKKSTPAILIIIAFGGLLALVGNAPWLLIAAIPLVLVWLLRAWIKIHPYGAPTKNRFKPAAMRDAQEKMIVRTVQVFQESAQIVANTKNKATARSRYELMLRLWQEGKVDFDGVPTLLQQARIKTEALEAGKKFEPAQIAITSKIVDDDFTRQLKNAESVIAAGDWEQARWAVRKLGYQADTVPISLQDKLQLLGKRIALEDPRYQEILILIRAMIAASPGQKQTTYYANFPEVSVEELREMLYWAAQAGILRRAKKGNTYLLYLPESEPQ